MPPPSERGTLPGGTSSFAYAVNDAGQVIGSASDSSGYYSHAFIWTKSGGMVDLGTGPNGYSATAKAINSKGWVAGEFESYTAPSGRHAFFWSPSTGMRDLGSLGVGMFARPLGDLNGWMSASPDELRGKLTLAVE